MEKYTGNKSDHQQWFDYEYKGFHLVLNLEEVQNYEYPELVEVLEKMIQRIKFNKLWLILKVLLSLDLRMKLSL